MLQTRRWRRTRLATSLRKSYGRSSSLTESKCRTRPAYTITNREKRMARKLPKLSQKKFLYEDCKRLGPSGHPCTILAFFGPCSRPSNGSGRYSGIMSRRNPRNGPRDRRVKLSWLAAATWSVNRRHPWVEVVELLYGRLTENLQLPCLADGRFCHRCVSTLHEQGCPTNSVDPSALN